MRTPASSPVGHDGYISPGYQLRHARGVVRVAVGNDQCLHPVYRKLDGLQALDYHPGAALHPGVDQNDLVAVGQDRHPRANGAYLVDALCNVNGVAQLHASGSASFLGVKDYSRLFHRLAATIETCITTCF